MSARGRSQPPSIPGRFRIARIQRCPAGKHWSLVVPMREADLSEGESRHAHVLHDVRIL